MLTGKKKVEPRKWKSRDLSSRKLYYSTILIIMSYFPLRNEQKFKNFLNFWSLLFYSNQNETFGFLTMIINFSLSKQWWLVLKFSLNDVNYISNNSYLYCAYLFLPVLRLRFNPIKTLSEDSTYSSFLKKLRRNLVRMNWPPANPIECLFGSFFWYLRHEYLAQ